MKIAVLGYGSQGRAWALNLKDSGYDIIVGLPLKSKSKRVAGRDGFKFVASVPRAVGHANIIVFAFPDHLHGRVFEKEIKPFLRPGSALIFLHGFSIHFKTLLPPPGCDIILLAPLAPGSAVREKYIKEEPIGYFYGIHRNRTGRAKGILEALVKALRIDKKRLIKTTFADEAVGDIFGEQAVLCGGLSQLIKAGYDTLVKSGLSSDKAYLEVAYQIDLIVDLIKKYGIEGMLRRISVTARVGAIRSGSRIIDSRVRAKMKSLLGEIKSSRFAEMLNSLDSRALKMYNRKAKELTSRSFEKSARRFSSANKKKSSH